MKKRMTREEELKILNEDPETELAEAERLEALRHDKDPTRWEPITDKEDLEFIHKVKETIAKKRGRPARLVPVERVFMKWPAPLLELVQKFAEEDGLSYQNFIRTTIAKEVNRRQKEGA